MPTFSNQSNKTHILMKQSFVIALLASAAISAQATNEPAQMTGLNGYTVDPVFTIGESINGYLPVGIPDGMSAYDAGEQVLLLMNHELNNGQGYPYILANGTALIGARVSAFAIDKETRKITDGGLAFNTIYNRAGEIVDDSSDLEFGALNRLCSAYGVEAGKDGFVDAIFFTGEETGGGTEWALDVDNQVLWAAPALGRGAWESVTSLNVPSINNTHVAILLGDDRGAAPLYLYVGKKAPSGTFLERNGLAEGKLYMWKANDGSDQPAEFTGTGTFKSGYFVEVENYNPAKAGTPGYDALGYADQASLDAQRNTLGAFRFSRPEDLHTNPSNGTQVVFASTGRSLTLDGVSDNADLWGTTYIIDVKLNKGDTKKNKISANLRVSFDGDDANGNGLAHPDFGIRSPDNLTWASNHFAYIQEDRSVGGFGDESGEETSIWRLKTQNGSILRVAQMDRSAIPTGQTDFAPSDLGNWESSGIIDASALFGEKKGDLLLFNVQAHSLNGGIIATENLAQGGQILFLKSK